jgi:TolB-like protein
MPSLLPGYEYDIFISYRHNDNRTGWVTEFVKDLREELASTIKEPVSVYFDSNPYDGLLETHDVNKSLEGKLNCLIFIPILSQTYCDVNSFAWKHEFIAFNNLAKATAPGREIGLDNGNVSSRILPVRIHELDPGDRQAFENETGTMLRCIDFIFKAPGINRPLTAKDDEVRLAGKMLYRDQVNKTAQAVKELLHAMVNPGRSKAPKSWTAPGPVSELKPAAENSIAVLPFVNMSSDPEQEYFSDGITEEILNALAQIKSLKVAGRTSSFQFKGKNPDLQTVGDKLKVRTILEGSVRRSGNKLRITAQLINVEDGFHLWSEKYDRNMDDIFAIQEEISAAITEKLKITLLQKEGAQVWKNVPASTEAYDLYLKGKFCMDKRLILRAITYFESAIAIDRKFAKAHAWLADAFILSALYFMLPAKEVFAKAKLASEAALRLDDQLSDAWCSLGFYYMASELDWANAKKKFLKSLELNPANAQCHLWYGHYFLAWVERDFEEAEKHVRAGIAIEPLRGDAHANLTAVLHTSLKYADALENAKKSVAPEPDSYIVQRSLGLSYLLLERYEEASKGLDIAAEICNRAPLALLDLILLNSRQGFKDKVDVLIAELNDLGKTGTYISPLTMAIAYGNAERVDEALDWMEMATHVHPFFHAKNYPYLSNAFRNDPRFQKIVENMNYPA